MSANGWKTGKKSTSHSPSSSLSSRARGAWTAACRSVTPAARWETSFPTGTTSSTARTGRKRFVGSTRPTTSPSSPAASAPRRAKKPASWASTSPRSRSKTSRTRSSTAPSPKAGLSPSLRSVAPVKRSRSLARDQPVSPAPSSSIAPGTKSPCLNGPTGLVACCGMASPNLRWRRRSSTVGSNNWPRKGSSSGRTPMSASTCR